MDGELEVLSVGVGGIKLSFSKDNPEERIRAARVVKDLLRRGCALMIEVKGKGGKAVYQRAHEFREDTCEYIIADYISGPEDAEHEPETGATASKTPTARGVTKKAVPAERTKAVAVGRTAGG